jgi:Flp pilus assembly protein TadG
MTIRESLAASAINRFRRDIRGVTAVEFGLVGLPFLALLLYIMEIAFVFLVNGNLDATVRNASRAILTGAAQAAGVASAAQFRTNYICPATGATLLGSFIDCTKLIIDVRVVTAFTASNLSNDFYKTASTNLFCPGPPQAITVVRVAYPMPSFLPLLVISGAGQGGVNTSGLVNDVPGNAGWKHLLVATSIFQTEPYPTASYTPPAGC